MTEFCNIKDLVNLFNPPKSNDSDSDHDDDVGDGENQQKLPNKSYHNEQSSDKINPYSKIDNQKNVDREIQNEIEDNSLTSEINAGNNVDWKKTPQWNISYRQQVSASDVFFQMGAKNPSTASCENMIVSIHLPGEHMQNIDIKVLKNNIEIVSPNFYLNLPLPQPVNPQQGNAKWEKSEEKLIVTLQMEREFDFINF